ncbi:MAG: TIGR01212 family radical SAM protein [Deltaproteobacteria bacterium]
MSGNLIHNDLRINSYGSYLRRRFHCRVSKVNVDGGFTCPNRDGVKGTGGCIFCNNNSFSPESTQQNIPIETQIAEGIAYHRLRFGSVKFVIYFQKHTNTYSSLDKLQSLYRRALVNPDTIGISIGTRPDCLADDTIDLLEELARTRYVCVELGLQSMDDAILSRINRGHGLSEYLSAVERLAGKGIDICTHLIYGFPGETREGFLETADLIAKLPVNSLKIHQLHAVKGTTLAGMYARGEFLPLAHAEYVTTVCDFLERIPPDIAIQRLYGSAPLAIRVAPAWGLKNNQMWYSVINELKRRKSCQGCRLPGITGSIRPDLTINRSPHPPSDLQSIESGSGYVPPQISCIKKSTERNWP